MASELARIVTFNFVDMDFLSSEKRQALPWQLPLIIDGLMLRRLLRKAIGGTCPAKLLASWSQLSLEPFGKRTS
jgi:hypothetical protein